jgi:hypothetical protein
VDEFAAGLLRNGILAVKEGDERMACQYLERVTNLTQDTALQAEAWFWMSETCHDPQKKRGMLENALANDLHHARARRSLAILDGKLKTADIIDSDHLPREQNDLQAAAGSQRFTCPTCGSGTTYSPDGSRLLCESCNNAQIIADRSPLEEQDFLIAMATARGHRKPTRMTTFKCQGCGADFLLAPGVISSNCSHCGSSHVLALESLRELIEPDAIIPMAVTGSQAASILSKWVQKKGHAREYQSRPLRGVYLPVWSFDLGGHINWSGTTNRNKRVQQIKGEDVVSFNDLAVPASLFVTALLEKMLLDFNLVNAPSYDVRFLAGWPAEVYQVSLAEAALKARQKASQLIRERIISTDGHLENLQYSTAELFVESFKLTLLPVWQTTCSLGTHSLRVLINGQNGRVLAEEPANGFSDRRKDLPAL